MVKFQRTNELESCPLFCTSPLSIAFLIIFMSAFEWRGGGFHIEPFLNILNSSVLQVENVSPFNSIKCYSTALVKCTVYSVQCTVYNVQCTMYSVQCTMYSVQCELWSTYIIFTKQMFQVLSPHILKLAQPIARNTTKICISILRTLHTTLHTLHTAQHTLHTAQQEEHTSQLQ